MLLKYQNFLQFRVNTEIESATSKGRSQKPQNQEIDRFQNIDFAQSVMGEEYLTKLTTEIPEVQSLWAAKQQLLSTKQAQYYDSERIAAVYYLKPNTAQIYLFKEEKQHFVAETLKFADIKNPLNPNLFTTVQIASNDKIYMIGGV